MGWDRERYRLEVLEPARRAGNVPPADLYARYGLSGDASGYAARIAEVVAYWRELRNRRTYARLAETLIAAHADLERAGRLTPAALASRQADAHREQLERLARLAEAEAGAATHVGPVTVARLRRALGGDVTDAQAHEALRRAGLRIVEEFPALPAVPPAKHADLAQHVQVLGLRLSAQVVFGDDVRRGFGVLGGFRLADGRRLDEEAIAAARSRLDALPYSDPAKTPSENVLAILRAAARRPGELDALMLSEVVERLRHLAGGGFAQKAVAAQARDLGLDGDEAGLIAAALLAGDTLDVTRRQVEEELTGGRLRAAQRLVPGLPAGDPLRERVADRDAEVAALAARAGQELAGDRRERAAKLLADALEMAGDDADLAERLAALPPPAPRAVEARPDGDHMLVIWEPGPALTGRPHYRVMRGLGRPPASPAEGTAVVTRTARHDATDPEAPVGVDLYYSVFASRGGETWSPPAATAPVVFAPDVADVSVEAADTSVVASWRAHPGADAVEVVRDDHTAVEATLTGFSDGGLRTGAEYVYRITATYRTPDGRRRRSAGLVVSAVPSPAPRAVTDLDVRVREGGAPVVVATWTPPEHGQVRLALSGEPPPWPPGSRITPADLAGLRELTGVPRRAADGRQFLELELPPGRHHLTALTAAGRGVVVGAAAEVGLVEPVRELAADRMHDTVRLSWAWPREATDALVRWPGGELRCSRRVYDDEGGVTLDIGAGPTTIDVSAIYASLTAPAVRTTVPGRGVAVRYRIRRASRLHPRRRAIELVAERPVRLPALVIVRATGPYAPDDPAEGETLARLEPRPIEPDLPVTAVVEVPRGSAWLACFVDPHAGDAGVLLFPPSTEEMRIR